MSKEVLKQAEERMNKSIESFQQQLATLRTGRANPSILDRVQVEYYGMMTPLNQLSSISVPEGRMLLIQPFDKSVISEIEKAIQKADLGLSPSNDGNVIRISVPALTEERREEIVKYVGRYAEEAKVAVRNVRREANDELKKMEKSNELTEDGLRRAQDDVQKLTDKMIAKIDDTAKAKEEDIREI
ncbi:ribosome recycling factor [Salisediminibacterium halotolerans]|uniref:Ribosome-recycling factor n=1 Tax=Salisediminibacterium halotolerans TaxID=517425 RepID=A0A1H9Q7L1_9BACI|nr:MULTISPECIES: ribosome recycling factor [Salisediminibacterium]RLJ74188.1 ribosome recycling factor [Actinophytocola xinjiangensis]RPE87719.1 ribosome recycling factor [Salisediminibacterium halotolerans]TWG35025.1 ribosome recycling factor [Salisediminibacterium halotolerans]SER56420.1 ribosome recycling factor [Salisediminibacterium haloalkalitolerans]GEL06688.1 ribosome-recycling factor [Salisediminibacterium halotolerans]